MTKIRLYIISSLAILAISLPLKTVLASQPDIQQRTVVLEDVIISEKVEVLAEPNGSLVTEAAVIIGTKTSTTYLLFQVVRLLVQAP